MQVSLSQSAPSSFFETQQLAWVQRAFQEVMTVFDWPAFIPPADTSFFLTTQLVLTGIGVLSRNAEIYKKLDEIFHNDLEKKPFHTPFPAEIYFLAMRITQDNRNQNDDWKITANPQRETILAAQDLVRSLHLIFEHLRTRDDAMFRIRFPDFEKAWLLFLDKLANEKKYHGSTWCGSFMLTNTLQILDKDWLYRKREEKIKELARSIVLNDESNVILPSLNAEISSIVYKKLNQVEIRNGFLLIGETVAEYLLNLIKDPHDKQLIDGMIKKQPDVFIHMLFEFTAIAEVDSPLLASEKNQVAKLQAKIKEIFIKHPKASLEVFYRRIFDSHATIIDNRHVTKIKDSKSLIADIQNSQVEWDIKILLAHVYAHHKSDFDRCFVRPLLLDYQFVTVRRVTGFAHRIIDLGLKTFEPKAFYAGFTKEISLIDK